MESQGSNNKDEKLVFTKKSGAGFDEHNLVLTVCKIWFISMINDAFRQMAKSIVPSQVSWKESVPHAHFVVNEILALNSVLFV